MRAKSGIIANRGRASQTAGGTSDPHTDTNGAERSTSVFSSFFGGGSPPPPKPQDRRDNNDNNNNPAASSGGGGRGGTGGRADSPFVSPPACAPGPANAADEEKRTAPSPTPRTANGGGGSAPVDGVGGQRGQSPAGAGTRGNGGQHHQQQQQLHHPPKECDFDVDPTELYLRLQRKDWDAVVLRSNNVADEASVWVSRKERDGKLRWRLLPLHAALIFKAPDRVIEALLCAYPHGAQCKDDQGMLPIHLAFRNGSSEEVVNLLLVAFPQSIDVKDRKGRIPLNLAQASASPNRDSFIRALERGPTYYAVAAAATERAAATAEQKALFETKLEELKEEHRNEIINVRKSSEMEKVELHEKVGELERELGKTQETSQVLVDHVNSLEAQLNSRSDTERFLATKIANLDGSLKEEIKTKEAIEAELTEKNETLQAANDEMGKRLAILEEERNNYKSQSEEVTHIHRDTTAEKDQEIHKLRATVSKLELATANSRANAAVLEAQLKKKIEMEHTLASQVSALAGRLAESAQNTSATQATYAGRVEALENEKKGLKKTITELTGKLSSVARALDAMAAEQERIVRAAAAHEESMARAAAAQARIVEDLQSQEAVIEENAREREVIVELLSRRIAIMEKNSLQREAIRAAVRKQEEDMEMCRADREELVDGVSRQRMSMRSLAETELKGIPKHLPGEGGDGDDGDEREADEGDDDDTEEDEDDTAKYFANDDDAPLSPSTARVDDDDFQEGTMGDADAELDEEVARATSNGIGRLPTPQLLGSDGNALPVQNNDGNALPVRGGSSSDDKDEEDARDNDGAAQAPSESLSAILAPTMTDDANALAPVWAVRTVDTQDTTPVHRGATPATSEGVVGAAWTNLGGGGGSWVTKAIERSNAAAGHVSPPSVATSGGAPTTTAAPTQSTPQLDQAGTGGSGTEDALSSVRSYDVAPSGGGGGSSVSAGGDGEAPPPSPLPSADDVTPEAGGGTKVDASDRGASTAFLETKGSGGPEQGLKTAMTYPVPVQVHRVQEEENGVVVTTAASVGSMGDRVEASRS